MGPAIEVVPLRLGTIDVDVADLRFGHTGPETLAVPMWAWLVRRQHPAGPRRDRAPAA
jgi:hypothetical protein